MGSQYLVEAAGCEAYQLPSQGYSQKKNTVFIKNNPAGAMLLQGLANSGIFAK
jgi:hypothetical protein